MDPDQQLRNLKDFLLVYNRMTEICFQRCTSNFNYRNLTMDEERCVDSCAGKLIRSNHRLMNTYVQLMPRMVQRRMEEMESKAAEYAKAAEATASSSVTPPATEASPELQAPILSSPPQQVFPPTEVQPEAFGSILTPAESDISAGLNAVMPASSAAAEVQLSAATPLTPVTEAVNLPVVNEAVNGLSITASFPPPPIVGTQIQSESSTPAFVPSESTSLSVDMPVSTVAAPPVSLSPESKPLPVQKKAPEVPPPPSSSGQ
ncbi:mitochondrial import inner membrane translocase subunit Tim10 B [Xyrichtys novacula]|uniref:Mitochondrial import inner membrane translocase subunit Tim10 B n=1 Tax=Xyrichtys novacula TaxID=13765 RepID=A0AAV1FR36_XYRNO|nr:mitochondrial import inner membrane translocase subunit Tim10 B [Xyrichtys novacula]